MKLTFVHKHIIEQRAIQRCWKNEQQFKCLSLNRTKTIVRNYANFFVLKIYKLFCVFVLESLLFLSSNLLCLFFASFFLLFFHFTSSRFTLMNYESLIFNKLTLFLLILSFFVYLLSFLHFCIVSILC